jgi:hypothetical protein
MQLGDTHPWEKLARHLGRGSGALLRGSDIVVEFLRPRRKVLLVG